MASRSVYDALMRLPLLAYAVFAAGSQIVGLHLVTATIDAANMIHVAMRLSTITFLLLIAAVVILRTRPSAKASGLEPRISALVGTFLTYGITLFPRHEMSLSLEMISTVLILVGTAGAVIALYQLGRSFSVMAETRQLVTSGPYRFVRHPLYLTEGIAVIGLFIQFASVWTALLVAVQVVSQLRRMHNEETLLTASFLEYAAYSRNTARLIPGIY
jgi:protein-S-isoprenylcysteine O-methyltransferase Ste14